MLKGDRNRVVITSKHLASGIRSLYEDLGSGLVPDHGCDLEGVEARLRNPYVTDALLF
jgi:hypothetical protein